MQQNKNVTRITIGTLKTLWKPIFIHIKDHVLLKSYRAQYKISMTAVLHMLIGMAGKCVEEQHLQHIATLRRKLHQENIYSHSHVNNG